MTSCLFTGTVCPFSRCALNFANQYDVIAHIEDAHCGTPPINVIDNEQNKFVRMSSVYNLFPGGYKPTPVPRPATKLNFEYYKKRTTSAGSFSLSRMRGSESERTDDGEDGEGGEGDERKYKCTVDGCDRRYKNLQGVKYHMRSQHGKPDEAVMVGGAAAGLMTNVIPPLSGVDGSIAATVGQVVSSSTGLSSLSSLSSLGGLSSLSSLSSMPATPTKYAMSRPHKCPHCCKRYKTTSGMHNHMAAAHNKQLSSSGSGSGMMDSTQTSSSVTQSVQEILARTAKEVQAQEAELREHQQALLEGKTVGAVLQAGMASNSSRQAQLRTLLDSRQHMQHQQQQQLPQDHAPSTPQPPQQQQQLLQQPHQSMSQSQHQSHPGQSMGGGQSSMGMGGRPHTPGMQQPPAAHPMQQMQQQQQPQSQQHPMPQQQAYYQQQQQLHQGHQQQYMSQRTVRDEIMEKADLGGGGRGGVGGMSLPPLNPSPQRRMRGPSMNMQYREDLVSSSMDGSSSAGGPMTPGGHPLPSHLSSSHSMSGPPPSSHHPQSHQSHGPPPTSTVRLLPPAEEMFHQREVAAAQMEQQQQQHYRGPPPQQQQSQYQQMPAQYRQAPPQYHQHHHQVQQQQQVQPDGYQQQQQQRVPYQQEPEGGYQPRPLPSITASFTSDNSYQYQSTSQYAPPPPSGYGSQPQYAEGYGQTSQPPPIYYGEEKREGRPMDHHDYSR